MQTKLLKTTDYFLLIDEEAEIKEGEYNTPSDFWDISLTSKEDLDIVQDKRNGYLKVVAYYPLTKEVQELDLPKLPNPFDPLERREFIYLVKNTKAGENGNLTIDVIRFESLEEAQEWCNGKSHLEIEQQEIIKAQSKQFSLEDVKKAFIAGLEFIAVDPNRYEEDADNYIQSLSTQQLPKEFIVQLEYWDYIDEVWRDVINNYSLKGSNRRIKTTTNSEGKQEIVGTYKY